MMNKSGRNYVCSPADHWNANDCIFNQINGAFHNYLSLYIGDNDNNTTFVGSYCLFVALVVTFVKQSLYKHQSAKNNEYNLWL